MVINLQEGIRVIALNAWQWKSSSEQADTIQVLVVFSDKPLDFQVPDIYPAH